MRWKLKEVVNVLVVHWDCVVSVRDVIIAQKAWTADVRLHQTEHQEVHFTSITIFVSCSKKIAKIT